jgi:hypothetical protein
MIKRNDLAKQFELVVKQEIINHNAQISQTNDSLNEFREALRDIEDKIFKIVGKENSNYSILRSELREIATDFNNRMCSQEAYTRDLENIIKNFGGNSQNINEICESFREKIIDIEDSITVIKKSFQELYCKVRNLENKTEDLSNSSLKRACDYTDKALSQHESKECAAQKVKKELKLQMDVDRVDFTGIMREMAVLKKESYVNEKKIENLYTLIERLKGK